jgi:hypothetical protein
MSFIQFFIIVELTVVSLPQMYAEKIMKHIAILLGSTIHIEFYVQWIMFLLNSYQPHHTIILTLYKNLSKKFTDLSKV